MSSNLQALSELIDHDGRPFSPASPEGEMILAYFGFTNCGMVCPRALDKLSEALETLGDDASRFRPLLVTVDPDRDSPAQMKSYLERYPRFTGLTGEPECLETARSEFRVFAKRKNDETAPGGYAVPHTAFAYVIDGDGALVTHLGDHLDAEQVAVALRDALDA